jgi:hypothetical protein
MDCYQFGPSGQPLRIDHVTLAMILKTGADD